MQTELQEALDTLTKGDNRDSFQEWEKHWDEKGTIEIHEIILFDNSRDFQVPPLMCPPKKRCMYGVNVALKTNLDLCQTETR